MDRYEILHSIGKGAFSEVYLGLDRETGNNIAIKKVLIKNKQLVLAEIKILQRLKEETLTGSLAFFDSFEDEAHIYVVTEYLGNYQELNIKDEYTIDEKAELMIEMIRGLNEIHRIDVIHLDIKPGNILVDRLKLKCKYIDFGMSCYDGDCEDINNIRGTPRYIYPEYVRRKRVANTGFGMEIDHWALAITMLNLLIGGYIDQEYAKKKNQNDVSTVKNLLRFILKYYNDDFVTWISEHPKFLELKNRYPLIAETIIEYLK